MLEISGLRKMFGRYCAVDDLSVSVGEGRALALWGPNGAGKTTVIRCLLGLLAYEGSIRLGGFCARWQGKKLRALLGYVPQQLNFQDDLTVEETLEFFAALKGVRFAVHPDVRAEVCADVCLGVADQKNSLDLRSLLTRVGLEISPAQTVGSLSGGMKQRLALAIALLGNPKLLVLDEPTSNLDLQGREDFLKLLANLRAEGLSLLFSSHRLEEVLSLADQVLVLEKGQVRSLCAPSELISVLGWQTVLKLRMAPDSLDNAVDRLREHGFETSRNGKCLWVTVPPDSKATPIQTLAQAGICVRDFEVQ